MEADTKIQLSPCERVNVYLMGEDFEQNEIAIILVKSRHTVNNQCTTLRDKFGVRTNAALMLKICELKIDYTVDYELLKSRARRNMEKLDEFHVMFDRARNERKRQQLLKAKKSRYNKEQLRMEFWGNKR